MKKLFFVVFTIFAFNKGFSQSANDSVVEKRTKFIAISPKKSGNDNVNGINLGILDAYDKQKINGINFQLNPLSLIYPLLPQAIDFPNEKNATVTINGIHISTGGTTDAKKLNGIGVSIYHHAMVTNGISANFYNNTSEKLNGIHVSGFSNNSVYGKGLHLSVLNNDSENFCGIQVALFNNSKDLKGLQFGLFNTTEKMKGLQIGFWNKNAKRSLPLINF